MARKSQQALKAEQAGESVNELVGFGTDRVDRVDTSIPLVELSPEIPSVPAKSNLTEQEQLESEPVRFKVKRDCKFVQPNGMLTILREGKLLDDRNYNLEQLKAQGVDLEQVKE